jgi:hypothetical protein
MKEYISKDRYVFVGTVGELKNMIEERKKYMEV